MEKELDIPPQTSFILTQKKISPKPIGYIFKQLMEQITLFL